MHNAHDHASSTHLRQTVNGKRLSTATMIKVICRAASRGWRRDVMVNGCASQKSEPLIMGVTKKFPSANEIPRGCKMLPTHQEKRDGV
jgi:hypothetical protein